MMDILLMVQCRLSSQEDEADHNPCAAANPWQRRKPAVKESKFLEK